MKKFVYFLLFFLVISFNLTSKTINSESSVCIFVTVDNISNTQITWLGAVVEERLEANLSKYTSLNLINDVNKKQIAAIQKESEGAAFDENSVIQAGKFTTAKYGLFTTVRKAGSHYTVSLRFTDLSTRETFATVVSQGKKNPEDLYSYNGCAVDEITIELCEQLGIRLTPTEKHLILHGEKGLSNEEKNKLYNDNINLYSQQIKELDKEIHTLSISSEIDAGFKQSQLEAERALAEEKLKLARENQQRALDEERSLMAESLKDDERTAAQKDRINAMSEELSNKIEKVRNSKFEKESVLAQIKVIELKKKALIEIKQQIDVEKKQILDKADAYIKARTEEINKRPPRAVETDDRGNLTKSAKKNREDEIKSETEKILKTAKDDIKQIGDKIDRENKKLLDEIYDDYRHLNNKTVNSLGNELVVDIGNYDGNNDGWKLFLTVKSENIIIFQTTSFLSYKELTGKNPVKNYRDPGFEDFANEVDLYESLFRRGEPILTFQIDYSVKPMSLNYPSKYKFYFSSFRYYDTIKMTVNGDKLKSSKSGVLHLDSSEIERQMLPAYDLRGFDNIGDFNYEVSVPDTVDKKPVKNNEKTETSSSKIKTPVKKTGRTLMAVNFGLMGGQMPGYTVELDFTSALTNYVYMDFNVGVLIPDSQTKKLYPVTENTPVVLNTTFKFGINHKFYWGWFKPNIFLGAGAGINMFTPYKKSKFEDVIVDCDISFNAGVDIPVSGGFGFILGYAGDIVIGKGYFDRFNIGMIFLSKD